MLKCIGLHSYTFSKCVWKIPVSRGAEVQNDIKSAYTSGILYALL